MDELDRRLGAAILEVLTSLSPTNLARGTTGSVNVPRAAINQLRDTFAAMYPGTIEHCQQLQREARDA